MKTTRTLPPHDGVRPLEALDLLAAALDRATDDAGIQGLSLLPDYEGDNIAAVADSTAGYRELADGEHEPVQTGLTVSACEIEGQSIAHRLLTPGYCLTWVAPAPTDPQDGDDSEEVGEYYRAREVAEAIVLEIVSYRLRRAAESRSECSAYDEEV